MSALQEFLEALSRRPDEHSVLTVATRESGHRDVSLVLGDLRAAHSELQRLWAIERRALDAERWTQGAGAVERSAGQREGVRYVLYGEVPSR